MVVVLIALAAIALAGIAYRAHRRQHAPPHTAAYDEQTAAENLRPLSAAVKVLDREPEPPE